MKTRIPTGMTCVLFALLISTIGIVQVHAQDEHKASQREPLKKAPSEMHPKKLFKTYQGIWKEAFLKRNGFTEDEFKTHVKAISASSSSGSAMQNEPKESKHLYRVTYIQINYTVTMGWAEFKLIDKLPIYLGSKHPSAKDPRYKSIPKDTLLSATDILNFVKIHSKEPLLKFPQISFTKISGVQTLAFEDEKAVLKEIEAKTGMHFHKVRYVFALGGMPCAYFEESPPRVQVPNDGPPLPLNKRPKLVYGHLNLVTKEIKVSKGWPEFSRSHKGKFKGH